jgi:hypothetical protein
VEDVDEGRYNELWEKGGLPKDVNTTLGVRPGAKK